MATNGGCDCFGAGARIEPAQRAQLRQWVSEMRAEVNVLTRALRKQAAHHHRRQAQMAAERDVAQARADKDKDKADVASTQAVLSRLADWTRTFGAALIPRGADTYGEGMRDAKDQVARIIAREAADQLFAAATRSTVGDDMITCPKCALAMKPWPKWIRSQMASAKVRCSGCGAAFDIKETE